MTAMPKTRAAGAKSFILCSFKLLPDLQQPLQHDVPSKTADAAHFAAKPERSAPGATRYEKRLAQLPDVEAFSSICQSPSLGINIGSFVRMDRV